MRGIVQGVGFRPFVHGLALRHRLAGSVCNVAGAVLIDAEGGTATLDQFLVELHGTAPPLSQIESIEWDSLPVAHLAGFRIEESVVDATGSNLIAADVATCRECLAELFDPGDRRFRYPFLNCTNCGPHLTIIRGAPYDRCRTTMSSFAMCDDCRAEYEDPSNRRFHAQPTACPACGPRLELVTSDGREDATADPLMRFAEGILLGQIGALKGLGGYHLVCDARNEQTVAELRRRKRREEMPLALLVRDAHHARRICEVSSAEQALLESPKRPIVLLRRIQGSAVCESVAPGNPYLGVMLPYTPLHHLLADSVDDIPLVMTSGNRTHEPIAYRDDDASERLHGVADMLLRHDRTIHVRCDDSVTRVVAGQELPVRRSRGYAPLPIRLPHECPRPMLAVGGQFKVVFALAQERQAVLSHHVGDLDHYDAYRQFEHDIRLFEDLFHTPELIVHDWHPEYLSTHYAENRARHDHLPLLGVQHHHAHMASCMAENGLDGPVIGVTFDGTGFGIDETTGTPMIWGGEFLVGDYRGFRRAAHLRAMPLPGGDRAVNEPWRMAVAALREADCDTAILARRQSEATIQAVETLLRRAGQIRMTSSAGRLFDAVAAIAGICDRVSYEGQAAMRLEWAATDVTPDGEYPFELLPAVSGHAACVVDTRPTIRAVLADALRGVEPARIARRFHSTLAAMIVATCRHIRQETGLDMAVLSGGVFLNSLLTVEVAERLTAAGIRVYRHRLVPPNDAGLCLGQLAVAAALDKTSAPALATQLSASVCQTPIHQPT